MPKAALSNNLQGALWILASCLAATVMTVGVKMASDGLSPTQIVFVRCVFSLVTGKSIWCAVPSGPSR